MSQTISRELFEKLVGKTCTLKEKDASHEIEILGVNPLTKRSAEGRDDPFVVEMRCREEALLPQQIFKISAEGVEALDIFFTPVGKDAKGHLYEAIFN